ncbi:MAG: FliI/YscN family ATPase [Paracoccaceae bacterium]
MTQIFDAALSGLQSIRVSHPCGHVASVRHGMLVVAGLQPTARIGAQVRVQTQGRAIEGEIVQVTETQTYVLIGENAEGIAVNDRVILTGIPEFAPSDRWIGRIIDPFGRPLDGKPLLRGSVPRPISAGAPAAADRRAMGARLGTGLAVFDTLLPLARGQRIGLFSGSGVGKSRLLARMARDIEADISVVALIGERGREVSEFVRETLGEDGLRRSVVVAATSDQSALVRRRCAWAAMTIAEHFRDQGKQVLYLADSVTRFAEAQREIAAISGEDLSLRGYPPSLTPSITALCERAGPGMGDQGDITAIFTVLVAGSNMDEPVADVVRGVLDGHIILDRSIAERGRFPAIDVLKSVSRALPGVASVHENDVIRDARALLGSYERSEVMIRAGLYSEGTDPQLDRAVRAWPELDAFFAKPTQEDIAGSFNRLTLILRRAGADVTGTR